MAVEVKNFKTFFNMVFLHKNVITLRCFDFSMLPPRLILHANVKGVSLLKVVGFLRVLRFLPTGNIEKGVGILKIWYILKTFQIAPAKAYFREVNSFERNQKLAYYVSKESKNITKFN